MRFQVETWGDAWKLTYPNGVVLVGSSVFVIAEVTRLLSEADYKSHVDKTREVA